MLSSETILKVDHAGEYGAIHIYRAQIALSSLFGFRGREALHEMLSHELAHFASFNDLVRQRGSRTCKALWLWSLGGYVLGTATALLGPSGIWACTYAVERTVNGHLDRQTSWLKGRDEELLRVVASIVADERSHRDQALKELPERSFARWVVIPVVSWSTSFAIWLSHRL